MKNIDTIIQESLIDVNKVEHLPFSTQGFEEFNEEISRFIIRLYEESARKSKREKSELINKNQVVAAANYLTKINKFKFKAIFDTIGGILIGSTASFLISTTNQDISYSNLTINIHIILGVIGAFILGYNLTKE